MTVESAVISGRAIESDIALAASGDEAAFTRIVAAYHPDLVRMARVVCGDPDMAADAAQAAWTTAWRRLGALREPNRLRPWLMAIAANEARQLLRSGSRRRVREIAVVDPIVQAADAGIALRVDLGNALRAIDPRDRTLIGLRYLAGLDSAEIGREVGLSATAVRSRLARAAERLRRELRDG